MFYGGAAGGGKALSVDTPLPTPWGWTTMGDVQAGDVLLDERGEPATVLEVSGVMLGRSCYRIMFSDGAAIVADAEHRWLSHRLTRRGRAAEVVTTADMAARVRRWGHAEHAVATAEPLDLSPVDLPLDPYLLGLWLGDGDTRRGYVTMDPADADEVLRPFGAVPTKAPMHWKVPWLRERLKALGLCGTKSAVIAKHVPAPVLRGSVDQRLAVVQGLVDADGHVDDRGQIEVALTSLRLVEGLSELLHSLGVKHTVRESRAMLHGRDVGPRWRVKWLTALPCARLRRKASRQKRAGFRGTHGLRYVVAVEPVASEPVQCIAVDSPSHLYLAGREMIPTHNSDALLMGALQYVDEPGYAAVILRRNFAMLSKPGALIPRSKAWLGHTDAKWNANDHAWTFPSGATITFGHLARGGAEGSVKDWQSSEVQYIAVDEVTDLDSHEYEFMFTRLRRLEGSTVPLRVRSASNPGGRGGVWVKERFVDEATRQAGAVFIPALLWDNPYLDWDAYVESLRVLHPILWQRLLLGDWEITDVGEVFQPRVWLEDGGYLDAQPTGKRRAVRYWDLAATEPSAANPDPDWSAGVRMSRDLDTGMYVVEHVARFRRTSGGVRKEVRAHAKADGVNVRVGIEQDPGQAGKDQIADYRESVLGGFRMLRDTRPTGDKATRASRFAGAMENGRVQVVRGPWLDAYLDELEGFTGDARGHAHDDQVDASSGAYTAVRKLTSQTSGTAAALAGPRIR